MAYKIPEPFKPVLDTELSPELQKKFMELVFEGDSALYECEYEPQSEESEEAAVAQFHQHVKEAVSAHPILARTTFSDMDMWSLLDVVCEKIGSLGKSACTIVGTVRFRPNIKQTPIHVFGKNGRMNDLLPWIMEHYPWVFEHKLFRKKKPHLEMMRCYANGGCLPETVRKFYELHPQGLQEKDNAKYMGGYPLSISLSGPVIPHADLFIWMAEQFPEAVHCKVDGGYTMLHEICAALTYRDRDFDFLSNLDIDIRLSPCTKCTPNTARICRFLISKHPDLVRQQFHDHRYLPIHMLAHRCNRPLVQEVALLLLKAYPESVHQKAGRFRPELSAVPFIQQVHPLVLNELEIDDEISQLFQLDQISDNLAKAAVLPSNHFISTSPPNGTAAKSSLLGSVSEVFRCWANLRRAKDLPQRKQQIQDRIADTCRLFEGEDRFADRYEVFDGDEYREFQSAVRFNRYDAFGRGGESGDDDDDDGSSVYHDEISALPL